MEQRLYFEDMNVGDQLKFQTKVTRSQVEKFLDSIGDAYREHLETAVEKYGNLVPPHLIPGLIANLSVSVRAYPALALVEMRYRFFRPVHIDAKLEVVDTILSKKEVSREIGQVVVDRNVTCDNSLVAEARIEHRLLRRTD